MRLQLNEPRDNAVDGILRHIFRGEEISATHEQIYRRVQFCYNQLVDGAYTHSQIIKNAARFNEVSETTAELDIQRAKIIYGEIRSIKVDAQYVIELQLAEKGMALALKKGDAKAFASNQANKLKILEAMREMEMVVDPRKFERANNYLVVVLNDTAARIDLNNIEKLPKPQLLEIERELKLHKDELAEAEIVK